MSRLDKKYWFHILFIILSPSMIYFTAKSLGYIVE